MASVFSLMKVPDSIVGDSVLGTWKEVGDLNPFFYFLLAKRTRANWRLQWNKFPNGSLSLFLSCSHPIMFLD